jgi:phosphoribosylaminoimidazole-succinocarboxamide synthase
MTVMFRSELPLPLLRAGKVREVYTASPDQLLLVASDRISAFDVVMNEPIAQKGRVLTQVSAFWFGQLADVFPSHCISANTSEIIDRYPDLAPHRDAIRGRTMLVRRTLPVPFECVVRGYITGSAWAEYRKSGTLAGEPLQPGMVESDRLDPPIFSPATKAETGHDENVTIDTMAMALGKGETEALRDASFRIYEAGRAHAAERGIIIADTKFEFGRDADGTLRLIDEVLTPDSSRFWPADRYAPGRSQPSFDKQPLRDYLAALKAQGSWNGDAPPPTLPQDVLDTTSARYVDAYERLTGHALPEDG